MRGRVAVAAAPGLGRRGPEAGQCPVHGKR